MSDIIRHETGARMSQVVIHNGTVYLAGQVGTPDTSVSEQTKTILAQIDAHLATAGTDKTRILQATIWLADMADFAEMNAAWDAWVAPGHAPARATGEARSRLSLEVLHHEVEVFPLVRQLLHLHDVRVADARRDPPLVEQHVDELPEPVEVGQDPLDHHRALEPAGPRDPPEENLGHPARAEPADDVVAPEAAW